MHTTLFQAFAADDGGATAIEYGLIVALLGLAIIGGLQAFTTAAQGKFDVIRDEVSGAVE